MSRFWDILSDIRGSSQPQVSIVKVASRALMQVLELLTGHPFQNYNL